jgi:hypothetical protein
MRARAGWSAASFFMVRCWRKMICKSLQLERFSNWYSLIHFIECGFFLRKKPLGILIRSTAIGEPL